MSSDLQSPYLAFAVICDHALIEQDGTVSLVRIVDTVKIHRPEGDKREPTARVTLAMGVKAGEFTGEGELGIMPTTPSGKTAAGRGIRQRVKLTAGEPGGANFVAKIAMTVSEVGLYWFDIYFEDKRLTRVPLLVSWSSESKTPSKTPEQPQHPKKPAR